MSLLATALTSSSSPLGFTKFKHQLPILSSFRIRPPTSISMHHIPPISISHNNNNNKHRHNLPTQVAFSGDGGQNWNSSGGNSGGGDRSESWSASGGDGNEKEEWFVLPGWVDKALDSMDLDRVIRCLITGTPPVILRGMLQFRWFKERSLADDLLWDGVLNECGFKTLTKAPPPPPPAAAAAATAAAAAEYDQNQTESFVKELDIVFADMVMAVIADFMLNYLPASTVKIAKFLYSGPDKAFQTATLGGASSSLLERLVAAVAHHGTRPFDVAIESTLVGKLTLINAKRAVQKSSGPVSSTSVAFGLYMAVSTNLCYRLLTADVEGEPLSQQHKLMLSAACGLQVLIERQSDSWIPMKINLDLVGALSASKLKLVYVPDDEVRMNSE